MYLLATFRQQRLCMACIGLVALLFSAPTLSGRQVGPESLNTVAVVVPDTANPYFSTLIRAADAQLRQAYPKVRLTVLTHDYSKGKESEILASFGQRPVQVLVIAATSPQSNATEFRLIRERGTKIVAVDVDAPLADVTIQSDNLAAGASVCEHLAAATHQRGRYVIVNGPQVSSVIARVKGCKTALERYPMIQILADDEDGLASQWGGQASMERYLRRFPSIDAVFGINDPTTLGAQKAASKVGRNAIYFGSVDGSAEARAAVRAPGRFLVTAAQDPGAIGDRAGKVSVALFERRYAGADRILLPVPLVVRH